MITALSGTSKERNTHHQQQERQAQHGGEEVRQPGGQIVGEVDPDGDTAGNGNVEIGAGRRRRQDVVTEPVEQIGRVGVLGCGGGDDPPQGGRRRRHIVGDRVADEGHARRRRRWRR